MASVAQGPRRLATKSPQVEAGPSTAEDRREKKRASDRLAQREHRRRQREYIDELEAQLRLIKEGSHSESVAALVAENERLKSELKQLREFASTINLAMSQLQTIAGASHPVSPAPSCPAPEHSQANTEPTKTASGGSPRNHDKPGGAVATTITGDSVVHPSLPAIPGTSQGYDQPYPGPNEPQRHILDFGSSKDMLGPQQLAESMLQQTQGEMHFAENAANSPLHTSSTRGLAEDANPADIYPSLLSRSAWERLGQLDLTILPDIGPTRTFLSSEDRDHHPPFSSQNLLQPHDILMDDCRTIQPDWSTPHTAHKSIPNILFPALRDDEALYAMVDSARWQAVITDTKIPKPDLVDCVLDSAANQFSLELKQYLEPMRRLRRNEEYFACYWLIATLIRLILDFHIHRVPIHPIMADLGEFLETNLSSAAGGLAMGEDQLVQSLKELKNWSLKPGFFDRHPQFREAYRQYAL
ncbi:hypothetical protein BJY01DRAFT_241856 [Aspergillus pseudoustus]|uniref:BZIP domain-containing protein n=1 Tax=Aspergillus pseudoustus TaxID=1810923 RepID=A0ABR4L2F3_9EURO